jgi:hypothetical protein
MFAKNKVAVGMQRKYTRQLVRSWYKTERDWNGIKVRKMSMIRDEDGLSVIAKRKPCPCLKEIGRKRDEKERNE